jgi:hypothetical protein
MEKLRQELRNNLIREELDSTLRLTTVGHLIRALNVDLAGFRRFWVQPLLEAGASLEIALACIAQSASSQIETCSLESPEAKLLV